MDASAVPTTPARTMPGMVLGTLGYMSCPFRGRAARCGSPPVAGRFLSGAVTAGFAVTSDGQKFLIDRVTEDAAPITILLNWAGLKR